MWELLGIMVVLGLPVAAIGLPLWLLSMSRRNRETLERMVALEIRLQAQRDAIDSLDNQVAELRQRLNGAPSASPRQEPAVPAPAVVTSQPAKTVAPPPPPVSAPAVEPAAAITTSVPPPPAVPSSPAPEMVASMTAGAHAHPQTPPFSEFHPPEHTAESSPEAPPFAAAPAPAPVDWETRLGANWLSKLGVAAMVIGLALFVGYSFTTMGAAGRVAMAALLSGAMLGGGVLLERREQYQILGRGLIAGGWAGAYLTTFAAYGVEAARVLTNPGVATGLLFAVAAGMIAHSLRYRSQTLTTLAFTLAALALGVSDSFGFALGALFPLAGALLVTAHRMTWPVLRVCGALACYVVVAALMFFGAEVMNTPALSGVLLALWALFELAALAAIRRGEAPGLPVFLLGAGNALAFVALLAGNGGVPELTAAETPHLQFAMLVSGVLLAISACVRAWLSRQGEGEDEGLFAHLTRGGYLPSAALAAACLAAFILTRFDGAMELGLLMGLGLSLVGLALMFRQRYLARVADAMFSFSLLRLYAGDLTSEPVFTFAETAWSARSLFALGHAAVFYVNRALFPRRAYYSVVATLILLVTLAEALPPLWLGVGYLIATLGLLEAARRTRTLSSLLEAWGVLAVAMMACAATWLEHEMQTSLPWQPVAASAGFFYLTAWQLWRARRAVLAGDSSAETAAIIDQGTVLVAGICAALALYILVPDIWICAAWMALAFVWSEMGRRFAQPVWPVKAMLLSAIGVAVLLAVSREIMSLPWQEPLFWLVHLLPAGTLFAMWWRLGGQKEHSVAFPLVTWMGWLPSALGVVVLAELASNLVNGVWVGLLWLLLGLLISAAGLILRKKELRLEAYVLSFLGACVSAILLSESTGDWFTGFHQLIGGSLGVVGLLALFMVTLRLRVLAREDPEAVWQWERLVPTAFALATGAYAVRVMFLVVEGRLLTMALGFEAIALLALGVFANLRPLRLGALGLLLFAVAKLFVYDLSSLVMPYRIASFFVLGALLLGVSWAYSRFGERIRRLL
ncbi:MAG: DUF2339 domain-containing protein [Bryobacterales bacterium]|nr:DUF2339 domain-containing protein [Bryobacterales bacterium]